MILKNNNHYLFLGIGNPDPEYRLTRHNAGIWFADIMNEKLNLEFKENTKLDAHIASTEHNNKKIFIAKSTTYMNHSGVSCTKICQFYKIPTNNVFICHDELDIPTGTIKYKFDGGIAGHNGLRSIVSHLQTQAFHRIRIGIDRPEDTRFEISSYVLQKTPAQDLELIHQAINKAMQNIDTLLNQDLKNFQQVLHTKI